MVAKELLGTILNMGNDTEKEKNDSMGDNVQLSPIPIFSRIRSVTVDQTGTMFCSCKYFERIGLSCVHMAYIAALCHDILYVCFSYLKICWIYTP